MKILFFDVAIDGHHLEYLKHLIGNSKENHLSVTVLPKKLDGLNSVQYSYPIKYLSQGILGYLMILFYILRLVKIEKPDIIHFLYGDYFYRYFGIGLFIFKKNITVMTFHHIRRSKLRDISLTRILDKISVGVIHTQRLMNDLNKIGINNCTHIEYPNFNLIEDSINDEILSKMKLPKDKPILLAIGGTREDKGLDILLAALKMVNRPFHLLISGKEETFKEEFINEQISTYKDKVTLFLKYLTYEEYSNSLLVSDIVVLPYKKIFDGASGPLADAVWLRKMIIGPNHGSLGDLIETYELGKTFQSENPSELAHVIEDVLDSKFSWSDKADEYRENLKPEKFVLSYFNLFNKLRHKIQL